MTSGHLQAWSTRELRRVVAEGFQLLRKDPGRTTGAVPAQ